MTKRELEAIMDQYYALKQEMRNVAERVAKARKLGDLLNNKEYEDAKAEERRIYAKITEIEEMLQSLSGNQWWLETNWVSMSAILKENSSFILYGL